mmetsp:Transcript_7128/g.13505  ORF Transcript_7128/g.13505 Transcript_7128/m.13505 type:complete len:167 (-) Transcript_7128:856-1356(-)
MEPELQSVIQGLQEEISQLQQQVNSQQGSSSSPSESSTSSQGSRQPKFAFAPAQLRTGDQFIDYSTKEGAKVFEDATAALSTHKFNGDKTRLPAFKADIRARATVAGWNSRSKSYPGPRLHSSTRRIALHRTISTCSQPLRTPLTQDLRVNTCYMMRVSIQCKERK